MSAELRVGIIGAGAIARSQHLTGWARLPQARVVALADSSSEALALAGDKFNVERRETDYRRLIDDPAIDIITCCAPSALHAEIIMAALAAGKHVLCEKPLATSRGDMAAILEAERRAGKKLMSCQHMRFWSSIAQAREHLERFPLGHVYYARTQWLRRRRLPGRPGFTDRALSGGGPIYDLGIHMLDLTLWMMNFPTVTSVSAAMFDHLARRADLGTEWGTWDADKIDVEDFAVGLLRLDNGGIVSLEASWLGFQPEKELWKLQFFGTEAGLVWPNTQFCGEQDRQPWDVIPAVPAEQNGHHEAIRQFLEAVLNDAPVPIPAWQSANSIAVLDAMYRSSQAGREVAVEGFAAEPRLPSPLLSPSITTLDAGELAL